MTDIREQGPAAVLENDQTDRIAKAMSAYTVRHVPLDLPGLRLIDEPGTEPRAGDLVLARVDELGHHKRLESGLSRRQSLRVGQEIIVAYGNRYATDQFLAIVPESLAPCHLVAAGGIAAQAREQHAAVDAPTRITPIGLVADADGPLTMARFAPRSVIACDEVLGRDHPPVIAVLGTAMNSGKTTTLASLVAGLTAAGLDVAAGKATGTGAGGDPNLFRDSGARTVLDFTDFGHPTTFGLSPRRIRDVFASLVDALSADGPDAVVIEIADGLLHHETAELVADPIFATLVDRVVFAAQDAMGATAAVEHLARRGIRVDAVSGVLTSSPLAVREARRTLGVPVVGTADLSAAATARSVFDGRVQA